jgi:hypothetical protein
VESHNGVEPEEDDKSVFEGHYEEPGFFHMVIGVQGSEKVFKLKGFVNMHRFEQKHGRPHCHPAEF